MWYNTFWIKLQEYFSELFHIWGVASSILCSLQPLKLILFSSYIAFAIKTSTQLWLPFWGRSKTERRREWVFDSPTPMVRSTCFTSFAALSLLRLVSRRIFSRRSHRIWGSFLMRVSLQSKHRHCRFAQILFQNRFWPPQTFKRFENLLRMNHSMYPD
jgi:hypothetical protein